MVKTILEEVRYSGPDKVLSRHAIDILQTTKFDGIEFERSACGISYESKEKAVEEANSKIACNFWRADDGPIQVRCFCGGYKFTLSYGSYLINATCVDCGATDEVYSG
jgi:hypothetical protein